MLTMLVFVASYLFLQKLHGVKIIILVSIKTGNASIVAMIFIAIVPLDLKENDAESVSTHLF